MYCLLEKQYGSVMYWALSFRKCWKFVGGHAIVVSFLSGCHYIVVGVILSPLRYHLNVMPHTIIWQTWGHWRGKHTSIPYKPNITEEDNLKHNFSWHNIVTLRSGWQTKTRRNRLICIYSKPIWCSVYILLIRDGKKRCGIYIRIYSYILLYSVKSEPVTEHWAEQWTVQRMHK